MRLCIRFSPYAYEQWLSTFDQTAFVGTIPSYCENPLAHFISAEVTAYHQIPLEWVAVHVDAIGPLASLAIRNGLFITRYPRATPDATPPPELQVDVGVFELRLALPPWTAGLVRRYTTTSSAVSSGQSPDKSHWRQAPISVTAGEARSDLDAVSMPASLVEQAREQVESTVPDEASIRGANLHLEVDLAPAEYASWRQMQQHSGDDHLTDQHTSAKQMLEGLLCQDNTYDVHVYLDEGAPKADVVIFTVELDRLDAAYEFHSTAYGGIAITFELPEWIAPLLATMHS